MRAIDITVKVDHEGQLAMRIRQMFKTQFKLRSGQMVRIRISSPKRSTQANAYYWGVVLKTIWEALVEGGTDGSQVTTAHLHRHFKEKYLPEDVREVMGVTHVWPASTKELDSHAFYEYIERIRTDDYVLMMGVDIPDPDPSYRSYNLELP